MPNAITNTLTQKAEELAPTLPELEKAMNYTLADAIREGSSVTNQKVGGWIDGDNFCALAAAAVALKARKML